MTAPAVVTEADFQAVVVEALGLLGWRHLHVRRTIGRGRRWTTSTNVAGWPDLLCWHPGKGRVLAIELKADGGKVTPEQVEVLGSLRAAGVDAYVFRPSDWAELEAVLR